MPEIISGARYVTAPKQCGVCSEPLHEGQPVIILQLAFSDGSIGALALHDTLACREPVGRWMAQQGRSLPDRS